MWAAITGILGFLVTILEKLFEIGDNSKVRKLEEANAELRAKFNQEKMATANTLLQIPDGDSVRNEIVKETDDEITIKPSAGFSKLPKP